MGRHGCRKVEGGVLRRVAQPDGFGRVDSAHDHTPEDEADAVNVGLFAEPPFVDGFFGLRVEVFALLGGEEAQGAEAIVVPARIVDVRRARLDR